MKTLAAAALVALLVSSCNAAEKPSFPADLEGTGRTCFEHLRHTDKALSWTLPFLKCSSPYKVISSEKGHVILQVKRGPACAFDRIEVKQFDLTDPKAFSWSAEGYIDVKHNGQFEHAQGCPMSNYN